MRLFSRVKRMITEPTKLKDWKSKLEDAKDQYGSQRKKMKIYAEYYAGTRTMQPNPNMAKAPSKVATNVRNIVYELLETEVDSSIPMPKVRPLHADDEELAHKIEHYLENKIRQCGLITTNDVMERNTTIFGGDFFHVQWDVNRGLHSEIGDLRVTEVHPKKLIPQPGVTELDNMDYFFIQELMTKKMVKRIYGEDVSDAENDEEEYTSGTVSSDIVTVNTAYYHNDHGGIGVYIWCDRIELLDMEDYQSRYLDRCAKCGTVMKNGVCPECGSKKSKKMPEEYEELIDAIEIKSDFGSMVPPPEEPVLDENGVPVPMLDENGLPIMNGQEMQIKKTKKKVPYYKPNVYPIVLRKNITENDKFLGGSDVAPIIDQQDTIKKLGTKINEKLLKGGSYVTLPKGKKVKTTDEELKIIEIDNPAEKAAIDVINVQPNVQNDLNYQEVNYQWAKNMLGVTDAYQGRFSASEVSGSARQYAINQAAGRLESKRVMKNEAYAKLYEIMFKYWLAYSDQTAEISTTDAEGKTSFEQMNRHDFLRLDKAGEFYWDDEFIFETDPTSTLMANREAMWNQTDMKLQSQAFGPLGDMETLRTYWTFMKAMGYPNAGMALDIIEERLTKQEQAMQQQAAMQQMGPPNEMPQM